MTTRLDIATTIFSTLLGRADAYQLGRLFEDRAALDRLAEQAALAADAVVDAVERVGRQAAPRPRQRTARTQPTAARH